MIVAILFYWLFTCSFAFLHFIRLRCHFVKQWCHCTNSDYKALILLLFNLPSIPSLLLHYFLLSVVSCFFLFSVVFRCLFFFLACLPILSFSFVLLSDLHAHGWNETLQWCTFDRRYVLMPLDRPYAFGSLWCFSAAVYPWTPTH